MDIKKTLEQWVRDFVEVVVTVGVILIVLRLLLGAHMLVPLVVVTSGSMEHHEGDNSWRFWLNEHGINESAMEGFPLLGGFFRGDMIVVRSPDVKLGDVIIYKRDFLHLQTNDEPIIHRVVGIVEVRGWKAENTTGTLDCVTEDDIQKSIGYVKDCEKGGTCVYTDVPETADFRFFITKGDNNPGTDQCATYSGAIKGIALPVLDADVTARGWIRLPYIGYVKLLFNAIIYAFKEIFLSFV